MSYHQVGLASPQGFMALMATNVRQDQLRWYRRILWSAIASLIFFGTIGFYVGIIFFLCLYIASSLTLLATLRRARRAFDGQGDSLERVSKNIWSAHAEYRRFMAVKLFSRAALAWHIWVIMLLVMADMLG